MSRRIEAALWALALALWAPAAGAGCPDAEGLSAGLSALGLERASRTSRFGQPMPEVLYREAAERAGEPVAERNGSRAFGAVVAALSLVDLWMAVNDEDHHDLDGGYLPVRVSEVIDGEPRGLERSLFQTFERWGVGRWWVSRVQMNGTLFEESEGRLWEIYWTDEMDRVDTGSPQIASAAERVRPIEASEGAWLMVPLAADCTLVEYYTYGEPGGLLGVGQMLMARKGVLLTLEGLLEMAREHVGEHDPGEFVAPDGTALLSSPR